MRITRWVLLALPIAAMGLGATASCSNSPPPPGDLAHGCAINSDCNAPLVCVFGLCHEQCAASRDCPMGERCVSSGADKVCELPAESTCQGTTDCPTGLTCSTMDMQCRNGCSSDSDCTVTGDICRVGSCYSPSEAAEAGVLDAGGGDSTADAPGDVVASDVTGDTTTGDAPGDAPQEAEAGPACTALDGGDPDAGPLFFHPSNFDPNHPVGADGGPVSLDAGIEAGAIDWTNAPDVKISTTCSGVACLQVPAVTLTIAPGYEADLFVLNSLLVNTGASISIPENYTVGSNPIIIAVRTTVKIQGTFNVDASGYNPGPGGFPVGQVLGPGGGGSGHAAQFPNSAAGGASFCGQGGSAAFASGNQAPGGQVYGTAAVIPLQGGSAGGEDPLGSYYGGGAGGGLQISAGVSIDVSGVGVINANGGNFAGAGGSGGAILLEAPVVTIEGIVVANGGGGGSWQGSFNGTPGDTSAQQAPGYLDGGAGGAGSQNNGGNGVANDAGLLGSGGGAVGWIRINTACGAVINDGGSTIVSPTMGGGCASQGKIAY
jgi:hypothetical protein